jgi:DNA-binding MarR family transcriptional regulator
VPDEAAAKRSDSADAPADDHLGVAFLLAQLGAHATERIAERLAVLGLTPAHIGLVRAIAADPGLSQQTLAKRIGVHPSRIVALIDDLERQGFVHRRRNSDDRRRYGLYPASGDTLRQIADVAIAHEFDISAALTTEERDALKQMLVRIAQQQGLTLGVHPGYRRLRAGREVMASSRARPSRIRSSPNSNSSAQS